MIKRAMALLSWIINTSPTFSTSKTSPKYKTPETTDFTFDIPVVKSAKVASDAIVAITTRTRHVIFTKHEDELFAILQANPVKYRIRAPKPDV